MLCHSSHLLLVLTLASLLFVWVDGYPTSAQPCDSPSYATETTESVEVYISTDDDDDDNEYSTEQLANLVAKKLDELDIKEIHQQVMLELVLNYLDLIKSQLTMPLPPEYYTSYLENSSDGSYQSNDDYSGYEDGYPAKVDGSTYVNNVNSSEYDLPSYSNSDLNNSSTDSSSSDVSASSDGSSDSNSSDGSSDPTSTEPSDSSNDTTTDPTQTSDSVVTTSIYIGNDVAYDSSYWSVSISDEGSGGISLYDEPSTDQPSQLEGGDTSTDC